MTAPSVVLLDEPTRGGDVGAKAEIFKVMRQLADVGLGIVFSTSDLKEALGYADRIIVMSHGELTRKFSRAEATEAGLIEASAADLAHEERLAS